MLNLRAVGFTVVKRQAKKKLTEKDRELVYLRHRANLQGYILVTRKAWNIATGPAK